ncbi:MAG TPA: aconitate hydratase AcnA [Leptolyngbyaceae cyanobacterium M65_K2018_010]|nr:aconitate hydratase AcnA [Leptolyngbyaceae cyanobacterium M65_K2018_010]
MNSFNAKTHLTIAGQTYTIYSLTEAAKTLGDISRLPFSLKVLLENLLRHEDGRSVTVADVQAIADWLQSRTSAREIAYRPARVLMQDFTGVPAVVDLAAMRDAMVSLGGDPNKINPLSPVDLVIDHSVTVDAFGSSGAFEENVQKEFQRNHERYAFLRWGQKAFDNFRVVPPGTGICHQVNLEYLAQVVWTKEMSGEVLAYPDTLVGTDSHTTMINGLAVLGWGVGGIEAEAAMLGQPISMLIPEVVGFKLTGQLPEGATATDLVLMVVQMLRQKGVVGKFVEFYGDGLDHLTLADRATIANMAPEYGATCGFFPIDQETLNYLAFSGRDPDRIALVEAYAKAQGLWRQAGGPDPLFTDSLALDLGTVEPSLAGPKRPQDRVRLVDLATQFKTSDFPSFSGRDYGEKRSVPVAGTDYALTDGDVVIAAITSCTNTSNPSVMIGAGLVARKARERGLTVKPWVKTSLAPGSQVVSDYLEKSGLQQDLDGLGFNLVGYGCTTCIGNSGPLPTAIAAAIEDHDLVVGAVLSGNRNFEGRVSPHTKANYLASPPLVVAYAIAGSLAIDLKTDPIGQDAAGRPVYLKDIWPTTAEIQATMAQALTPEMFRSRYSNVFTGPESWQRIDTVERQTYPWQAASTYVQNPPYFTGMTPSVPSQAWGDIRGARPLAILGDSITTDHISPAGAIKADSPAGHYLREHHVPVSEFNSYGSRRGNHEVMMRGTFANIRLKNEMVPGSSGGVTRYLPSRETLSIYEAAIQYQQHGIPLLVIAGKEYGTGSSRDWAAKGTRLLGVKAVIAESFERIHRSNLVGMGVLPLQFPAGLHRGLLRLEGDETFDVLGLNGGLRPGLELTLVVHRSHGDTTAVPLLCRIDTLDEVEYFRNGGILPYVLRQLLAA